MRYIVSEFIEGQSLTDFLKNKPLSHRAASELFKKIADAVAHAHENGITHRDLKPSNVLIDAEGKPHLLDFGLAKLEIIDQTLTADDLVLGTPGYMSPEQARGASRPIKRFVRWMLYNHELASEVTGIISVLEVSTLLFCCATVLTLLSAITIASQQIHRRTVNS